MNNNIKMTKQMMYTIANGVHNGKWCVQLKK